MSSLSNPQNPTPDKTSPASLKEQQQKIMQQRADAFMADYESLCRKHMLRMVPMIGEFQYKFGVQEYVPADAKLAVPDTTTASTPGNA